MPSNTTLAHASLPVLEEGIAECDAASYHLSNAASAGSVLTQEPRLEAGHNSEVSDSIIKRVPIYHEDSPNTSQRRGAVLSYKTLEIWQMAGLYVLGDYPNPSCA